jgi:hypothetical protein
MSTMFQSGLAAMLIATTRALADALHKQPDKAAFPLYGYGHSLLQTRKNLDRVFLSSINYLSDTYLSKTAAWAWNNGIRSDFVCLLIITIRS